MWIALRPRRDRRRQAASALRIATAAALIATLSTPLFSLQAKSGLRGAWLGQDGRDSVGPYAQAAGNGFQDIHLQIQGLPPSREIRDVIVRGHGRDEWRSRGDRIWLALVERKPRSSVADIFIEPARVETGREFSIEILFADNKKTELYFRGGKADPNSRPASQTLRAQWIGQQGEDYAGACAAPGPDGLQDVRIDLSNLQGDVGIAAIAIEPKSGGAWEFGPNPKGCHRAEIIKDAKDKSRGRLYFQPDRDLQGQPLVIRVSYDNGKSDSVAMTAPASAIEPRKAATPPAIPAVSAFQPIATWKPQPNGDVAVQLSGLPKPSAPLAAVVLTDGTRGSWLWKVNDRTEVYADPESSPLRLTPGREPGRAEVRFRPIRDESRATMTLRLIDRQGRSHVGRFSGGACDPAIAAPAPAASRAVAKPGDDLQALANRHGAIDLAPGVYRLNRPLILDRPIAIAGTGGATLLFAQRPDDKPWTAAIKIRRGRTSIQGFAVRFAGPIRWDRDVSYGPAVIGTTDNRDPWTPDILCGIRLAKLDLESPPVSQSAKWEEAIHLIRVVTARNGTISGNRLKGGTVEFADGPWTIVNNEHQGTPPGTFCYDIFAGHHVHDAVIADNRAKPVAPYGLTWRFLVLTHRGANITVERNAIERVGPREDDPIPHPNVPETILTESYRLTYEGKPGSVSADGRLLTIAKPLGEPAATGSVVAVLSGPKAGHWVRIAQAVRPHAYLVDPPLPDGSASQAVAIASGFVDCRFRDNTINNRGSGLASNLVLAGNHFGTAVTGNRLIGGAESFRIHASATEQPHAWGWSHAPFFGGVMSGNRLEDAVNGGVIAVEHNAKTHLNRDRVYMTIALENNEIRWSDPFTARDNAGVRVGDPGGHDSSELRLTESGNRAATASGRSSSARPVLKIVAAQVNGREVVSQTQSLPNAPASASAATPAPAPSSRSAGASARADAP